MLLVLLSLRASVSALLFARVVRDDGTLAYRWPKASETPGKIGAHPLLEDFMGKVRQEGYCPVPLVLS